VVNTGKPEGIITLHFFKADKDILKGIIQGMAHVEGAGNIGRRDDDGVGLFALVYLPPKISLLFPIAIPFLFNFLRDISRG
jgi:hypothetical protein